MERDERARADALDRYWDVVVRDDAPSTPTDVDPGLATLVTQLHAAGRALPTLVPDLDQAWRTVRAERSSPTTEQVIGASVFPPWTQANGHVGHRAQRSWAPPLPWRQGDLGLNQLATAALLLLTLAVGFVAISLSRPATPDAGRWVPALVRALDAAPGVVDTPLVETTFAPAELPSGEKEAVYYQLTLSPGDRLPYLGGLFCGCRTETMTTGVGVEVVQAGTYTVRLEAPLRVQRAGSSRPNELVPAGTEVTLTAGDAVIFPDYAAPGDIRNAGDEPVTLTGVVINATEGSATPVPKLPIIGRTTLLAHSIVSDWKTFPPGPLYVALHQVTLPLETTIGPYQPVGLQALHVESGTILRTFLPAGETVPRGRPLPTLAGTTASFLAPSPGLRETVAADGDQPAELLVVIIEPAVNSVQSLTP